MQARISELHQQIALELCMAEQASLESFEKNYDGEKRVLWSIVVGRRVMGSNFIQSVRSTGVILLMS